MTKKKISSKFKEWITSGWRLTTLLRIALFLVLGVLILVIFSPAGVDII